MNLLEHFKKFRGHSDLMFSGPLKDKDDSAKVSYVLLWMGEKGRDIYRTLVLTEEQRNDICEAFERHVQPKSNPVFSRYKFHNEKQGERTTEAFITRLKTYGYMDRTTAMISPVTKWSLVLTLER